VLAFLIDALGWENLSERPFLDDIIRTRCPLRTVLGFSSGAEPSILTGLAPMKHGRWTMYARNPARTPFRLARWTALWPEGVPGAGSLRRFLAWWVREKEGVRGYFDLYEVPLRLLPQFDLPERANLFDVAGVSPVPSLFDRLSEKGIPFRSWSWRSPEERNFAELTRRIGRGEGGVYFLYSAALDALQHVKGTRAPEVSEMIDGYERRIGAIFRLAEERGLSPSLFVFSDHGMTDTVGTIDLMSQVAALGLDAPRDYLPFYDSTMARFWTHGDGAREKLVSLLRRTPHGRLLEDVELAREGVLFEDRRYGEIVFLMDPGWQIEPSFMGRRAVRAMHGFHPDDPGSSAVLLSSRAIEPPPADIRDLYGILLDASCEAAGA
jgi:hypothetical protein